MKKCFFIASLVLTVGLSGCAKPEDARNDKKEAFFETIKSAPLTEGKDEVVYHLKDKRTQKCYYYIDGYKTATFEEVVC